MKAVKSVIEAIGKKKILADVILVASLLVIGLSVFLISELTRKDGAYVTVYVGDSEIASYSLSVDGEYPLNGGTNILIIKDGEAYMTDATCPDELCVKQGKISKTGEKIVCLPNRVMVEVYGADEEILELK